MFFSFDELKPGAVFEPDDLDIMERALELACSKLQDRGDTPSISDADVRAEIARAIIRLAENGERSPEALAQAGLAGLNSALSSTT